MEYTIEKGFKILEKIKNIKVSEGDWEESNKRMARIREKVKILKERKKNKANK